MSQSAYGQAPAQDRPEPGGHVTKRAVQRAREHIGYALDLAERQAVYSAQDELIRAMRLIATDYDLAAGAHDHEAALDTGLQALNSINFRNTLPDPSASMPDSDRSAAERQSAISAMQRQLFEVQQRLAFAGGHEPTASMALFLLGQSQISVLGQTAEEKALAGPKAISLYQAALAVDEANYLAVNELGALYAKCGQWGEAERVLAHGAAVAPQPTVWHNLAVVRERMGNTKAAQEARRQHDALVAQRRAIGGSAGASPPDSVAARIRWTDPSEFVRCSATDDPGPPAAADKTTAPPAKTAAPKPEPKQESSLAMPNWMISPFKNLGGNSGAVRSPKEEAR